MHTAFEATVVTVTVVGILLATTWLAPFRAAREIGQVGESWIDHAEDHSLEDGPDCSEDDPPIPFRPLRPQP